MPRDVLPEPSARRMPRPGRAVLLAALALILGCAREKVEEPFQPSASYDQYRESLGRLDLESTDMGRAWIEAGQRAVEEPVLVRTPFEEAALLDPREPSALGYTFSALRGRVLTITVETTLDRYFADLFRSDPDGLTAVASRPPGGHEIRVEPRRDGVYVLRVQPELLRGGSLRVRIVATASLAFPVEGGDPGDIWSFYGDPRDGGERLHEGVDIFAARGTPVRAAADGVIASVETRTLGGKVITLRLAEQGLILYYAHLDEQLVQAGERVHRGDVIGRVGNTGNAVTTPPHLHLGIYEGRWRRDVDPWNYLVDPATIRPPTPAYEELAGSWRRLARDAALEAAVPAGPAPWWWTNRNPLLRRPGAGESRAAGSAGDTSVTGIEPRPREATPLAAGTPVRIVGAAGRLVRVRTPAGHEGFVRPADLEEARDRQVLESPRSLHDPARGDMLAVMDAGSRVDVLGREEGRTYVLLPRGRIGYLGD